MNFKLKSLLVGLSVISLHTTLPKAIRIIGPDIIVLKQEIQDSGGDSVINPGEVIYMTIWLSNIGSGTANNVYAILTCDDSLISISVDSSYYGNIEPNDSSSGSTPYIFSPSLFTPDEHPVSFDLTVVSADSDTWVLHPSIIIRKPILEYYNKIIVDPDSNHVPAPG